MGNNNDHKDDDNKKYKNDNNNHNSNNNNNDRKNNYNNISLRLSHARTINPPFHRFRSHTCIFRCYIALDIFRDANDMRLLLLKRYSIPYKLSDFFGDWDGRVNTASKKVLAGKLKFLPFLRALQKRKWEKAA